VEKCVFFHHPENIHLGRPIILSEGILQSEAELRNHGHLTEKIIIPLQWALAAVEKDASSLLYISSASSHFHNIHVFSLKEKSPLLRITLNFHVLIHISHHPIGYYEEAMAKR
jgi:hypothetical protein